MTQKAVILTIPRSSYEAPDQLLPCEFEQLPTELHTKHFQKTPKIVFLHKDYHIPRGTGMLKMRGLMVVWGGACGCSNELKVNLFALPFLSHLVTSWDLLWTLRSFGRAGNSWVRWEKWRMRWQLCQLLWGPELLCFTKQASLQTSTGIYLKKWRLRPASHAAAAATLHAAHLESNARLKGGGKTRASGTATTASSSTTTKAKGKSCAREKLSAESDIIRLARVVLYEKGLIKERVDGKDVYHLWPGCKTVPSPGRQHELESFGLCVSNIDTGFVISAKASHTEFNAFIGGLFPIFANWIHSDSSPQDFKVKNPAFWSNKSKYAAIAGFEFIPPYVVCIRNSGKGHVPLMEPLVDLFSTGKHIEAYAKHKQSNHSSWRENTLILSLCCAVPAAILTGWKLLNGADVDSDSETEPLDLLPSANKGKGKARAWSHSMTDSEFSNGEKGLELMDVDNNTSDSADTDTDTDKMSVDDLESTPLCQYGRNCRRIVSRSPTELLSSPLSIHGGTMDIDEEANVTEQIFDFTASSPLAGPAPFPDISPLSSPALLPANLPNLSESSSSQAAPTSFRRIPQDGNTSAYSGSFIIPKQGQNFWTGEDHRPLKL
ncbi:hypothetical protein BXZ70DRAFT_911129 [Cristinia sonorae]|uniref:Uncharacterized protein n=1 Tax=Cristinia sonorae TaxID=1940300 RepID=A0A8K0UF48_9AGAR|nr:hypothetical protein BXZ70DRAFT_911129 [Cristinia sonorae]